MQMDLFLSFVYFELFNIEIVYDFEEEDVDYLLVDFFVSEGVIFKNQVILKMFDDGMLVLLFFFVFDIVNLLEIIIVILSVMDGDEIVIVVFNIMVVNKVLFVWMVQLLMSIFEENGGII